MPIFSFTLSETHPALVLRTTDVTDVAMKYNISHTHSRTKRDMSALPFAITLNRQNLTTAEYFLLETFDEHYLTVSKQALRIDKRNRRM